MAKTCDSCECFIKINFQDGRKGICDFKDYNIKNMKGEAGFVCKHHAQKKYNRHKSKRTKLA